MRRFLFCLVFIFLVLPLGAWAQAKEELNEVVRAQVLEILDTQERDIPGTGATALVQTLQIKIFDGQRAGDQLIFENEQVQLKAGDVFFLNRLVTINNDEFLLFKEVDRRGQLIALVLFFVVLMVWFAGWQGVRAMGSLVLSALAILFVLVPLLLAGYNAAWVSLLLAAIILALALFGTHGTRPYIVIAYIGTMLAVGFTCIVAVFWVGTMRLSGFGSDASVYLNFATDGKLDFAGLLLGSIIIGILGVLDDVSITQSSVVQELKAANPALQGKELYTRAIRVGRDHVASLINTLALAYVGVALPLVLFLSTSEAPLGQLFNQEIVAAEIVRIIIGSIGVILAVPFTTALAAWWFGTRGVREGEVVPTAPCGHRHHDHI